MGFGIWPTQYADGELLYAAYILASAYAESDIPRKLTYYRDEYSSQLTRWQKAAEWLKKQGGGVSASNNNALFGQPIDRSKPNTDRIFDLVLSAAAASSKEDTDDNRYSPATVPMLVIKNQDGTYLTWAGTYTRDKREARHFYERERSEAERMKKPGQTIVEA